MKKFAAFSAALLVGAVTTVGLAGPAAATLDPGPILLVHENVWYQSFQRPSETAPCVAPTSLDVAWQADWPAAENTWSPSWDYWPNGGKGGWVCNRQITWSPAIYQHVIR